jgi:hypothetical protein
MSTYNKIKIKRDGTMNKLLISLVAIGCLAAAFRNPQVRCFCNNNKIYVFQSITQTLMPFYLPQKGWIFSASEYSR